MKKVFILIILTFIFKSSLNVNAQNKWMGDSDFGYEDNVYYRNEKDTLIIDQEITSLNISSLDQDTTLLAQYYFKLDQLLEQYDRNEISKTKLEGAIELLRILIKEEEAKFTGN